MNSGNFPTSILGHLHINMTFLSHSITLRLVHICLSFQQSAHHGDPVGQLGAVNKVPRISIAGSAPFHVKP